MGLEDLRVAAVAIVIGRVAARARSRRAGSMGFDLSTQMSRVARINNQLIVVSGGRINIVAQSAGDPPLQPILIETADQLGFPVDL
jgi:hypothetical protein